LKSRLARHGAKSRPNPSPCQLPNPPHLPEHDAVVAGVRTRISLWLNAKPSGKMPFDERSQLMLTVKILAVLTFLFFG